QQQILFRSPLAGAVQDSAAQIRRSEFSGKRSLAEFQQNQQGMEFYLRNVKMRPSYNNQHASPISPLSPAELSAIPGISTGAMKPRYGIPIIRQQRTQQLTIAGSPEKSLMNYRLQELEKELLGDDDGDDDEEAVSVITNSEWSEAIRDLIGKPFSPSPTSSSSSCSSTSVCQPPPCPKQALIDAAAAISDGKQESAAEILTRLAPEANNRGTTSKQRLAAYMVSALKSRVGNESPAATAAEVKTDEHAVSTKMLYSASPCFKLGLMAANLAILEASTELRFQKIHVLDFELGQGTQYVHLLKTMAAAQPKSAAALTITVVSDGDISEEKLRIIGDCLKSHALKIGVPLNFHIVDFNFGNIEQISRENLRIGSDEALAVNFAFKLHKLPDESVSVDNIRDELLRRVKSLSPTVVTVVEQELNSNTAPLATRVRDSYEYYSALLESLDATIAGEVPDRALIDDGIGRKIANAVGCEGRERVERCEVFGKWRARMRMAGFQPLSVSPLAAESLRGKLNGGTRVNQGFTVIEDSGGICFGWRGKTLAVASVWR
ncbi:hypothetical protein M569_00779, partial [Genlisea aurea]